MMNSSLLSSHTITLDSVFTSENLNIAIWAVNKKRPFLDVTPFTAITADYLKENVTYRMLLETIDSIKAGKYVARPCNLHKVENSDKTKIMIRIPHVVDHIIQRAVFQVLSPFLRTTFSDSSFGGTPLYSHTKAHNKALEYIEAGNSYLLKIHVQDLFQSINHDRIIDLLRQRIEDKVFLHLIRKILQSPVSEKQKLIIQKNSLGIAEGSPIAHLLSDFYLDLLDKSIEKHNISFIRSGPNVYLFFTTLKQAKQSKRFLTRFIENKLDLKLNPEKTSIISLSSSFSFSQLN